MAAEERIGRLDSHNLFLNLYLAPSLFFPELLMVPARLLSEYLPEEMIFYSGLGLGLSFVNMDYRNTIMQSPSPGDTTVEQNTLEDTLFGYQVLAGFDYWLCNHLSKGVQGRYISFYSFRDDEVWDQLWDDLLALHRDRSEVRYLPAQDRRPRYVRCFP